MKWYYSPDERSGGSSPSGEPHTESTGEAPVQTPSDHGSSGQEIGPVPYDRFKSVNEERKTLKEQLEQEQKRVRELSEYAVRANERLAQIQEKPAKPENPTSPEVDLEEQYIQEKLFGTDENGNQAREAMERYFQWRTKRDGWMRREDVERLVDERIGASEGRQTSRSNMTNRFQKWVTSGMIDQEEARDLQRELVGQLQTREWAQARNNPDNVDYLVERLLTRAIENGKIRPYSKPRSSPLQPGGSGGIAPPAETEIDLSRSPFASLRNLDKDHVKKLTEISKKRYQGAMAE